MRSNIRDREVREPNGEPNGERDLNLILNEAVPRWAKLTNTKLDTNTLTLTLGSDSLFQDHDLKTYIADLNEARQLDPSGSTAILLLRGLFSAYVEEMQFSAHTLLYQAKKIEPTLAALHSFHGLIHEASCDSAVDGFRTTLRAAAKHYQYAVGRLKETFKDELAMGQLRLAALRSIDKLHVHQFSQGDPDTNPLQYNREIFEFWNVNSFLAALQRQWVSGITLVLIRNPANFYLSYFALGLRNGDTTTVLTDFEEGTHPDYYKMTRRPDRRLDERASLHWFPYRLLETGPKDVPKHDSALVALNAEAVAVAKVAELEPSEFIWLTLLFELIAERYGKGNFKTEELSYTGEMVVNPHTLIEAASALVKTGHYQPLILPKLSVETATAEAAGNEEAVGHNAWMEERYKHRVPGILLNVVGAKNALEAKSRAEGLLPRPADNSSPWTRVRTMPGVRELKPKALDPTRFGTRDQIDKDRVWAARTNMMQAIGRMAEVEFTRKHATIVAWYRAKLERNMDFILAAVARGELSAPVAKWLSTYDEDDLRKTPFPANDTMKWSEDNIVTQRIASSWRRAFPGHSLGEGFLFGAWRAPYVACYLDPARRATVFTLIRPDNPKALALLLGMEPDKLPWPLQHWYTREPYVGNSILSRVDPADLLDNPWQHLDLGLIIALSKRAYNAQRKARGLGSTTKTEISAVRTER